MQKRITKKRDQNLNDNSDSAKTRNTLKEKSGLTAAVVMIVTPQWPGMISSPSFSLVNLSQAREYTAKCQFHRDLEMELRRLQLGTIKVLSLIQAFRVYFGLKPI